jgi:hypothetical protein
MRPHSNASTLPAKLKHASLVVVLVAGAAGVARAQDPPPPAPATSAPVAVPQPPTPPDVSAPATVPAKWEPGIAIEQLPAGAYPEGTDGGIFGMSLTLGPPTRGIWGGSLWYTFHGLQWPYIPKTGVGVSGYAWVDTGYVRVDWDQGRLGRKFWLQEARAVLRVTPTYSNGSFFIQAQVELVGNKDQTAAAAGSAVATDDVWVRVGHWNRWDLQLGRFESWEVFHLGMGLDVNTLERRGAENYGGVPVVTPYLVRFPFETRPSGPGYTALHLYPTSFLRFELLGISGADFTGLNSVGTRPAMVADFGMIKLKLAAEYIRVRDRLDYRNPEGQIVANPNTRLERGIGGGIIFILDPRVEAGINAAAGRAESATTDGMDGAGTFDVLSVGGFANARIIGDWIVGAGATYTRKADNNLGGGMVGTTTGYFDHLQGFGAVQYVVARRLFIKAVFGYAQATIAPGGSMVDLININYSGRIRLQYLF